MKFLKSFLVMVVVSQISIAQTINSVFDPNTQIIWLGLDFTDAKLIGDRERLGSESDVRYLIDEWNGLLTKEADKFNIAACIDRKKVEPAIDVTLDHNLDLDVFAMFSESDRDYQHLSRERVSEIVTEYDFKDKTGVGLMFNIESFSKLNNEGSMWITFINLDTREVLLTERMVAPPGGSGVRNNWINTVFGVMEKMKKKEFETWKKKYYRP